MIINIEHPDYQAESQNWYKWRLAYEGGWRFIRQYLLRYSTRETDSDFAERQAITYCPSFAKVGINEVKDSIYTRMADVAREGGSKTYQEAVTGKNSGVDLLGSSMDYFMGCKVLKELLTMGKVGIYVDMPELRGPSLADNVDLKPYIYSFPVECIKSWVYDENDTPNEFSSILLQEDTFINDPETGFPCGQATRYRRLWKEDGQVMACFYNENGIMCDQYGIETDQAIPLLINKIPFIVCRIDESLMTDVADYQIALLNLASSDMAYTMKANFPFYTEQRDNRSMGAHLKKAGEDTTDTSSKNDEIKVGIQRGRYYFKDLDRPGFIHPSPEPLKASMEKQVQLKEEIRQLLKLAISNLSKPAIASAESKKEDTRNLENGLNYIGLVLQNAETKIAEFWAMYEATKSIATIIYPNDYSLTNDVTKANEADHLVKIKDEIPSATCQKFIQKRLARLTIGNKISSETLKLIDTEIDTAEVTNINPQVILDSVEKGLVSNDLASQALGFPPGEADKAAKDHEARLTRIAISQSLGDGANAPGARGNNNLDGNPSQTAKDEKSKAKDTTNNDVVTKKVRGKAS